jgi:predicted TIM-barrel enzyme
MLIAMKKDLGSVIKGYVFQPTMAENITKIKSNCITVMEKYKTGGGITTYSVNTDMNTTETLQQDILYVAISCVPVGCIEQVEITFTLNRSVE